MKRGYRYVDDRDRILLNIAPEAETGCWIWLMQKNEKGYGLVGNGKRRMRIAHRFSYELFVGPIPAGLTLDHLCERRDCVNPSHLEPVTQQENSLRSPNTLNSINAAKTHCPRGHPYDEVNTYVVPSTGGRMCRICIAAKPRSKRAA